MSPAAELDPQRMSDSTISSGSPPVDQGLADARAATVQALGTGVTAIAVLGGAGAGKTALCEALAAGVDDRSFTTSITDPSIDPDTFLLQLLNDFGLSAGTPANGQSDSRDTLTGAVVKFLKSLKPLGAHALVIIDDAEQIGVDVYETVLQLVEASGFEGQLFRLVLVGQPALDARLGEPPLSAVPVLGGWTRVVIGEETRDTTADRLLVSEVPPLAEPTASRARRTLASVGSARVVVLAALLGVIAIGGWRATTDRPTPTPARAPLSATPAAPAGGASPATAGATSPSLGTATPPATAAAPAGSAKPTAPAATPAPTANGVAAAPAAMPSGMPESYRIVIAAFKTAARAEQVVSELERQRLPVAVRVDPTATWHQVVAGPYPSIDSARQAQRALERAGFSDTQISLLPPTTNR